MTYQYENCDLEQLRDDPGLNPEDPEVLYAMAQCFRLGRGTEADARTAGDLLELAARAGSQRARDELAREAGPAPVPQRNYGAMGIEELEELTGKGDPEACRRLYFKNRALRDEKGAERYLLRWLELAESGNVPLSQRQQAFYTAGVFYQERDLKKSRYYLEQGKELESVRACKLLLNYYAQGIGGPVSRELEDSCIQLLERKGTPGDLCQCARRCLERGERFWASRLLEQALERPGEIEDRAEAGLTLYKLFCTDAPVEKLLPVLWEAAEGDEALEGLLQIYRDLPMLPVTDGQAARLAEAYRRRGDGKRHELWTRRAEAERQRREAGEQERKKQEAEAQERQRLEAEEQRRRRLEAEEQERQRQEAEEQERQCQEARERELLRQVEEDQECQAEDALPGDITRQERTLRRSVLRSTMGELSEAMTRLMTETYYKIFSQPERLEQLLLPLTVCPENNPRVRYAVIRREALLSKCTPNTQRRTRQSAAGGRKRECDVKEEDLQRILPKKYRQILREELQTCGPEVIRSFFDLPDLAAWFKLNTRTAARENYESTYQTLCQYCPELEKKPLSKWSNLCKDATDVRNNLKGHDSYANLDETLKGSLREEVAPWLEIADLLHSEELNGEEYRAVYRALERGETDMGWEAVPFQILNRHGQDNKGIRGALESNGIRCEADCALYSSIQELNDKLDVIFTGYRWISLDEVRPEYAKGDDAALTEELTDCGLKVEDSRVFCASPDQVRRLLEVNQARKSAEEESVRLRTQLKQTEEEQEQARRKRQEDYEGQWANLPRLDTLLGGQSGPLSHDQLQELVRTHQLVLDPSVLRSRSGQSFVQREIVPRLKEMRQAGKEAFLVMEATARYHLYQDYEAYREMERVFRAGGAPEGQERMSELRSSRSAYYFAQEGLYRTGLLRFVGVPYPGRRDEEGLRMLLRLNSGKRVCVLTCGAADRVTEAVSHEEFPLCAVARIMPAGGERTVCQIFSAYLPLAGGGREVDLLDTLQYYSLQTETYAAGEVDSAPREEPAFPAGPAARPDSGRLLPLLNRPVAVGDMLITEGETQVKLLERLQEDGEDIEGGEGALYRVDDPGQVAKLYHDGRRTVDRERKLRDMLAHDPGIRNLCWPTHMLYTEEGEFVGYLMPKAPEGALSFRRSVLQLNKESVRRETLPGWDRYDLAQTALACARLMARLHAQNILMGDVNDGNFMVDPRDSGSVWLVDCDSYQFNGWPCPVSMEDYTHPNAARRLETTGLRTEEEEDYALAILLFQILMLGLYPFDSRKDISPAQAMREKVFPFTAEDIADVPAGDEWMIWKNMTRAVTQAFCDAFKKWEITSAAGWTRLLDTYRACIEKYDFSRELIPLKYHEFTPEKPFYQDVVCEIDQVEFNMPASKYREIKARGQHILCRGCWRARELFMRQKRPGLICDSCGREFAGDDWQVYLKETLGDPVLCPRCRSVRRTGA